MSTDGDHTARLRAHEARLAEYEEEIAQRSWLEAQRYRAGLRSDEAFASLSEEARERLKALGERTVAPPLFYLERLLETVELLAEAFDAVESNVVPLEIRELIGTERYVLEMDPRVCHALMLLIEAAVGTGLEDIVY